MGNWDGIATGTQVKILLEQISLFLCWLPLIFGIEKTSLKNRYTAWIFDVGQGTAVLIKVANKVLLYDTGPSFLNGNSAFKYTLEPYLIAQGINTIDRLVLSHNDRDHTGGHQELRDRYQIEKGITGSTNLVKEYGYDYCKAGMSWRWQQVSFRVLSGTHPNSDNNSSCVLLIDDGNCSLLLTGDIDQRVETKLVSQAHRLTWLLASHHGSKTGTGTQLLASWQPRNVIYSAGFLNQFGHPAKQVKQRVTRFSEASYFTAEQGAIKLDSQQEGCTASPWRDLKSRFWAGYSWDASYDKVSK